ncbi:class I SAM-dependent methyltransferase [Candidatus Bathyarchaeota archaeon]|nr:MAG: class I SAM-dependent methyltransferase [Candidatus Bathyarchaeota archaeon]
MKGGFPSSTLGPCRQRTHIWASVLIVWTSGQSMKGGVNITLIVVKDRDDLSDARREYYASLAEFFLNQIGRGPDTILEAGSGKGQMTFPLIANLSRRARLITVDSSEGPYEGSLERFHSGLKEQGLGFNIRSIKSDVRKMSSVGDASVDAVISNELLCDLRDEVQLSKALQEFYRVLRPGGVMIHGEWCSCPANRSQKMTINADSCIGTSTPSKFWNPDELFAAICQAGFERFSVTYFATTMRLKYPAAVEELRIWGVRKAFIERNDKSLRRYGIELPFEHIVRCRKPVRAGRTSALCPQGRFR